MIQFELNSVNTIVVTLTENATVASPIYLFKFTRQESNVDFYFIATDQSGYKERYNLFTVTDKTNEDTLNGETNLGDEGYYDYTIYQTNLQDTSGLSAAIDAVANIVKTVETGLVWVAPTVGTVNRYTPASDIAIVYTP